MKKLLCINSSFTDPSQNLATEEYLLKNSNQDIFILYINSPSIIIGKHQNALAEINFDFVEKKQIKVVRRLSGGGTVYHDVGNLNYSWIMHGEQGKIIDFKKYTKDILEFLQSLSIDVKRNKNNDLLIAGKKISGNAEHVFKNKLIHHGTLLFNSSLQDLNQSIKVNLSRFEDKSVQSKRSMVTNISDHLHPNISMKKFRNGLFEYMMNKRNYTEEYNLNEEETRLINELAKEKYSSWDWNFGYSPKYQYKKESKINGIQIHLNFFVVKGKIADIDFNENFLSVYEKEIFKNSLLGKRHKQDEIKKELESNLFESITKKLPVNNLLELFF